MGRRHDKHEFIGSVKTGIQPLQGALSDQNAQVCLAGGNQFMDGFAGLLLQVDLDGGMQLQKMDKSTGRKWTMVWVLATRLRWEETCVGKGGVSVVRYRWGAES